MMTNGKPGFTLIELLVVISIIAILSVIGLVSLNGARERARDSKRRYNLTEMNTALQHYYEDSNFQYPLIADWAGVFSPDHTESSTLGAATGVFVQGGNIIPTFLSGLMRDPLYTKGGYEYFYIANCDTINCAGATHATDYVLYTLLEASDSYYAVSPKGKLSDISNNFTTAPTCPQNSGDCLPPS